MAQAGFDTDFISMLHETLNKVKQSRSGPKFLRYLKLDAVLWESTLFQSRVLLSSSLPSTPTLSYLPINGHRQEDAWGEKKEWSVDISLLVSAFLKTVIPQGTKTPDLEAALGGQILSGCICQQKSFHPIVRSSYFIPWWLPFKTNPKSQVSGSQIFPDQSTPWSHWSTKHCFQDTFKNAVGFEREKPKPCTVFCKHQKLPTSYGPFPD